MQWAKTINRNSSRLLLIFSGWSTDADTLQNVGIEGCDTIVIWDYTNDSLPDGLTAGYSEILLVGWSFGVFMAGRFLQNNPELPITLRVAINGTLHPIHDKLGIPKRIFSLTYRRLNKETLCSFWDKMCGDNIMYTPPQRPIENLKCELERIANLYAAEGAPEVHFDKAFIADKDAIIPSDNQLNAWDTVDNFTISGTHFPDFNTILGSLAIDKERVKSRFGAVAETYHNNAVAQRNIAQKLVTLAPENTPFSRVLELGCGTGMLTEAFLGRFSKTASLTLTDLRPIPKINFQGKTHAQQCDAEALLYTLPAESFSTIISSSTIQWFNSLQGLFANIYRILEKGGIALISTFGPLTFQELFGLAPRLELPTIAGLKKLIPDGLKVECAKEEIIQLVFETPMDVLRHFHNTGVNSIDRHASPFALLRKYPRREDGKCVLTYHPIYLILRKK